MKNIPVPIEIYPRIDDCIETQAKRLFKEFSERILQGEDGVLIDKLEVVRTFLATWDFNILRAESERHLAAGRKVKFILRVENGKSEYEMKVD
ncbi:MAG: hypothetical protein PHR56_02900 [Dehalococcoidales bacterium]|nr:hypothetical protein [Dehalococcoidales bacterium]